MSVRPKGSNEWTIDIYLGGGRKAGKRHRETVIGTREEAYLLEVQIKQHLGRTSTNTRTVAGCYGPQKDRLSRQEPRIPNALIDHREIFTLEHEIRECLGRDPFPVFNVRITGVLELFRGPLRTDSLFLRAQGLRSAWDKEIEEPLDRVRRPDQRTDLVYCLREGFGCHAIPPANEDRLPRVLVYVPSLETPELLERVALRAGDPAGVSIGCRLELLNRLHHLDCLVENIVPALAERIPWHYLDRHGFGSGAMIPSEFEQKSLSR